MRTITTYFRFLSAASLLWAGVVGAQERPTYCAFIDKAIKAGLANDFASLAGDKSWNNGGITEGCILDPNESAFVVCDQNYVPPNTYDAVDSIVRNILGPRLEECLQSMGVVRPDDEVLVTKTDGQYSVSLVGLSDGVALDLGYTTNRTPIVHITFRAMRFSEGVRTTDAPSSIDGDAQPGTCEFERSLLSDAAQRFPNLLQEERTNGMLTTWRIGGMSSDWNDAEHSCGVMLDDATKTSSLQCLMRLEGAADVDFATTMEGNKLFARFAACWRPQMAAAKVDDAGRLFQGVLSTKQFVMLSVAPRLFGDGKTRAYLSFKLSVDFPN